MSWDTGVVANPKSNKYFEVIVLKGLVNSKGYTLVVSGPFQNGCRPPRENEPPKGSFCKFVAYGVISLVSIDSP